MTDEKDDLKKPGAYGGDGAKDGELDANEVSRFPKWTQDPIKLTKSENALKRKQIDDFQAAEKKREADAKTADEKRLKEQSEFKTLAE